MGNDKRFKKDPVDRNMNFDSDDVSNSEEEYSDTERQLLEKVRRKRTVESFDSEDEVYGLRDDDDDEEESMEDDERDSMASDIEGLPRENDDDLPDERAWGKRKRAYYSTDYVDQDYASASHKDLADAEMEEKEARSIQKRLAEQLDDADFGLDFIQAATAAGTESKEDDEEIIKADLSTLSKRQKQALVQKESPEFRALVVDFKERMTEAKDILAPFLKLVEQGRCSDCLAVSFVNAKYQLVLNYCVNVNFYLMLKAKKIPVNSHPVVKRLAQFRRLLGQLEERQGELLVQVREIVEADKAGKPLYGTLDNKEMNQAALAKKATSKKVATKRKVPVPEPMEEESDEEEEEEDDDDDTPHSVDALSNENGALEGEAAAAEDEMEIYGEDEKRAITYQIAKNKGLTPHRKKEQRNPRVKHRNKYRKAKIRRKGAVREVRKEVNRYDGEISGIKASVKKSIKLR